VVAILEDFSSVLTSLAQTLAQYFCCHDSGTISREILKISCVLFAFLPSIAQAWLYVLL